jgi:hypothetical protein
MLEEVVVVLQILMVGVIFQQVQVELVVAVQVV